MDTRAATPCGLPYAPRIPVCKRSAPAHDNILLMRNTWNGCKRTRRWKPSFPALVTMYLFAAIRPASIASEPICSFSKLRVDVKITSRQSSSSVTYRTRRARPPTRITVPPLRARFRSLAPIITRASSLDTYLTRCTHAGNASHEYFFIPAS